VRLVIMGTPGAGKGTQAKLLAARIGAAHISTGDILREAVQNGSALGRKARRFIQQGHLVPGEVVVGLVEERLDGGDCAGGFILDGYPRTVHQAEVLDTMLARRGEPLGAVLHIAVPREVALERIAGRRVCQRCAAMFHLEFDPPTDPGRCDRCGGPLAQREDDRVETVQQRMDVYARETAPVLDYYRRAGILREISGVGEPEDVFLRVAAAAQ